EIKVWLEMPGTTPISLINVGGDGTFLLPANFDQNLGPLTLFPSTAGLPTGADSFNSRTLDPVTGRLLNEDLNPFTIGTGTEPVLLSKSDDKSGADEKSGSDQTPEPEEGGTPPRLDITLSKGTYTTGEVVTATEFRISYLGIVSQAAEIKVWT